MKRIISVLLLCIFANTAVAKHITGGEMIYEFLGNSGANAKNYRITLRLFRDQTCVGCADMPATVTIGVFNNSGGMVGGYRTVGLSHVDQVPVDGFPPCIINPPTLDYAVGYYEFEVTLNNNTAGYTITYQTCCRIDNITNIPDRSGATYSTQIPGSSWNDSSPQFNTTLSVMCFHKPFTLDFSAFDPDGDSLSYYFCAGLNGGDAIAADFATPAAPPYTALNYINGYNAGSPLGPTATIDPTTGIISGLAPDPGKYVVSVCVNSFRNGIYVSTQRKDFIVNVHDCDFAGAQLNPTYITCDGFTLSFSNQNNSPLNLTYYWNFGDPASLNNTSSSPAPTHTYSDTGVYTLKLVVNRGMPCSDSTTALVRVFPGYIPGFTAPISQCRNTPVQFHDATFAQYGLVNGWSWNFGIPGTLADTSHVQNPVNVFPVAGTYTVTLIVSSNKGCIGNYTKDIQIVDRAPLDVTNDTLICSIDTLQLNAVSPTGGTITWNPSYNINDIHSLTPLVSPDVTTTYYLSFTDNFGCHATDSVKVRVVDFVTFNLIPDTTICKNDSVVLPLHTDGLYFTWTPSGTIINPTTGNPTAVPVANTTYSVLASIGKCIATGSINVKVVPYPDGHAGADTSVCFATNAFLHASGGSIYQWMPAAFLNNPFIPDPTVQDPTTDILYVVSIRDTFGCPKPVYDTVYIKIIRIIADAGPHDTSVVAGQPLQLFATGGTESASYSWYPSTWLNNPLIQNPVSYPEDSITYVLEIRTSEGCFGTDSIRVHYFTTAPDIFVPTAFTPNGDTKNNEFRPIPVGMRSVDLFNVYNRWGQLVYSSTNTERGWDGYYKGKPQDPGTFVWYTQGIDYTGKKISKKGYVVLIR